ncbi:cell division protein [Porphyrobacter sp. GA68]|uniref:cell division protein n=1 Tax=Porphyrobacter sp. GA68 TaxID=2883480 RepID=UPI001D195AD0|nr:cell division protein [Porphyrobacter sp. GA68]
MTRLEALRPWLGGDVPILPAGRIGGPLPWLIALMVLLVTVGLAGALVLAGLTRAASAQVAGSVLVQIVEADPAGRAAQTDAAAAFLRTSPAVAAVRVVPQAELEALLEPWLGEGLLAADIVPVPALLDVQTTGTIDARTLRQLADGLRAVAPAARLDAQADWLAPLMGAVAALRYLAASVALLLAFVGLAAVWLSTRFALASNAQTVKIVHALGGDDGQIASVFQRAILPDAIAGSLLGAGLGAAALWLLGDRFAALDAGLLAGGGLGAGDWLILALVPVGAATAAALTARVTVLATLRKSL